MSFLPTPELKRDVTNRFLAGSALRDAAAYYCIRVETAEYILRETIARLVELTVDARRDDAVAPPATEEVVNG